MSNGGFSRSEAIEEFRQQIRRTKGTRQIIRLAKRQNRQWDSAVHYLPRSFVHRAISSGCDDNFHWLFQSFFPVRLLDRLVKRLKPVPFEAPNQLLLAMFTVSRFRIMD